MISPIAPALMATALVASISLYAVPDDDYTRAHTMADNYTIFHTSHVTDAIAEYDNFVDRPGEATVVDRIVFTPDVDASSSIKYNKDGTIDTHKDGSAKETGPCKEKHLLNGKDKCGTSTTVTETIFGPAVDRETYFSQARDVDASQVIAFNSMGNWKSQMFLIAETNKLAVITWPGDAGSETYDADTMNDVMAQIAADSPKTPDFRSGTLSRVGVGSTYSLDGMTFSVSGLDTPTGAQAIVTLFDAS